MANEQLGSHPVDLIQKLDRYIKTGEETPKVEIKQSLDLGSRPKCAEFAKDVMAIANSRGWHGYIILGVMDKRYRASDDPQTYVAGFAPHDWDALRRQMVEALTQFCEPMPEIQLLQLDEPATGKSIGVVLVPHSPQRPHMVRRGSGDLEEGDIFVRHGSATYRATRQDLDQMQGQTNVLVNFSHPVTDEQRARIEQLASRRIEEVIEAMVQIDEKSPLVPQVVDLIENTGLTGEDWQTIPLLVNLPGYAPAAAAVLSEIHGRMGHFPTIARLRPIRVGEVTQYEVAELVDLQNIRGSARLRR